MKQLAGKTAIVTGATSGIGLAMTRALAASGTRVAMGYRFRERADAALSQLDAEHRSLVQPLHLDVMNRESVAAAAEEVRRTFGNLHILCNCAGVNLLGTMEEATHEDWDWIMGVNFGGVVNTVMSFLPLMRSHGEGGHIVNVASMGAFITGPRSGIYATSKFAVRGLSESLRYCVARYGIGVSLVCPGLTNSPIYEAPLRRPESLRRTGFPLDAGAINNLKNIHACGMDPDEVARKTLLGVLTNRFYVFSHPEFRDEVRELHGEIDAAFDDEAPDPRRMPVETLRREMKEKARQAILAL